MEANHKPKLTVLAIKQFRPPTGHWYAAIEVEGKDEVYDFDCGTAENVPDALAAMKLAMELKEEWKLGVDRFPSLERWEASF